MSWTTDDLLRLDEKYAYEGVHPHQRAFRAAVELLGPAFQLTALTKNTDVSNIMDAWARLFPDAGATWPGMGIGLAASVDQVRKTVAPVGFGQTSIQAWSVLGFSDSAAWEYWCRGNAVIAAESWYAVADLLDFTYGVDDLRGEKPEAQTLWRMAASNLSDVANTLPATFSVDSVIQPICMTVELSIKAALVHNGAAPADFAGRNGHNLTDLSRRMMTEMPHRDDALIPDVIQHLPPYVASRYAPAGLNRLAVVRLALAAQFVAASSLRRHSTRDMDAEISADGWPAPRPPFFP